MAVDIGIEPSILLSRNHFQYAVMHLVVLSCKLIILPSSNDAILPYGPCSNDRENIKDFLQFLLHFLLWVIWESWAGGNVNVSDVDIDTETYESNSVSNGTMQKVLALIGFFLRFKEKSKILRN